MDITADQIAFLVTFLVTTTVVAGIHLILSQAAPSPRQKRRTGYLLVIVALCVFVLAVLDVFGLRLLSGDLDTRSALFAVLMAIMSSLAAFYLIKTGSAAANQLVSAGLFLVLVLTFFLGLFWAYLPVWFGSVSEASFEAASVTFSFKSKSGGPTGVVNISTGGATKSGLSVFERDTDYQFGAETLQFLAGAAPRDIARMKSLPIACTPGEADCQCAMPDAGDQSDRLGCLFASLDMMEAHFGKVTPFANCLVDYAQLFPNGLPMHQALAEISLYLTSRPWAAPASMNLALTKVDGRDGEVYAQQIFEKLGYIGQLSSTARAAGNNRCSFSPGYWSELMSSADAWAQTFKPPHRTLFEASIIVSAGYPHDAALYIERQLGAQLAYLEALADSHPGASHDAALIRSIFEIRTLAILDQLYAHLDEKPRNAELLTRFRASYRRMINLFLREEEATPTRWLSVCADRRYDDTYLGDLMKIDPEFENYFVASLYSALAVEARFVEVGKFTNAFDAVDIDELRATTEGLRAIAMDDIDYQDCFATWVAAFSDPGARRQLKAQLFETYAALGLASIELQAYLLTGDAASRRILNERIDRDELRVRLCTSRDVAIAINANRRGRDLPAQDTKIVDALRAALTPIQLALGRNGVEC